MLHSTDEEFAFVNEFFREMSMQVEEQLLVTDYFLSPGLAIHSLQFLEPRCTCETARQAMHRADLALFPARRAGRHNAQIDQVFDGRMA